MQYILSEEEYSALKAEQEARRMAETITEDLLEENKRLRSRLSETFGEKVLAKEQLQEANKTIESLNKQLARASEVVLYWINKCDKISKELSRVVKNPFTRLE